MPTDLVQQLKRDFKVVKASLDLHLVEGVGIKIAIAEVKRDQVWLKGLMLILLGLVLGLYFKR